MNSTTSDFNMATITLGRLYFMLSCRLTPTDALSVQHGRCVNIGATCAFTRPHISSGVGYEALWVRLLVGFWCEDTCHVRGETGPAPGSWYVARHWLHSWCNQWLVKTWVLDQPRHPFIVCTKAMLLSLSVEGTLVPRY
jgi:hypothetical protein